MRDILSTLNSELEIAGSMVITPDGIMVAAAMNHSLEEDSTAAFAASLLLGLKKGLSALRVSGGLRSCSLTATKGKLLFFNMENSYLVVLADPASDVDGDAQPIREAIQKITSRRIA